LFPFGLLKYILFIVSGTANNFLVLASIGWSYADVGLAEGNSLGSNSSSNSPEVGWSRGGLGEI
jgi:hypothetical protein